MRLSLFLLSLSCHHRLLCVMRADVKPHNILVNHKGEVKLSDFGIVAQLSSTAAKCHTFVGTHLYMSPERISASAPAPTASSASASASSSSSSVEAEAEAVGGGGYSYRADIWGLGMSLVYCATGSNPIPTGLFAVCCTQQGTVAGS